eukprot:6179087-Pleurochrysis_carterae.AAC.1
MFFRLDPSYTFEAPSPLNPTFPAAHSASSSAPAGGPAGGTRSGAGTQAQAASQTSSVAPSGTNLPPRNLTTEERARFVVSPEHIASVDRQLM